MGLSDKLKKKIGNLQTFEDKSVLQLIGKGTEKNDEVPVKNDDSPSQQIQITQEISDAIQQSPAQIVIPTQLAGDVFKVQQEIEKENTLSSLASKLSLNSLLSSIDTIKDSILNHTPQQETLQQRVQQHISENYSTNKVNKSKKLKEIIEENENSLTEEDKEFIHDVEEEIKENYEKATNTKLDDNVDIIDVIENIDEVLEESNDTHTLEISLGDFEIVNKSKTGYTKTVVGFKKDTPTELSRIATLARKISDNLIKPRTMDIININNINKTQLRGSSLKLGIRSFVFKPDTTRMKVPKFTRFIISLEDDFLQTKMVLIYLQSSRNKIVIKTECDIEFLGKLIYSFFKEGFETTKRKLQFKYSQDPLLRTIPNLVKSGEFIVMPLKVDEENQQVKSLKIKSKGTNHQWLTVFVNQSKTLEGAYDVYATADFDPSWKIKINHGVKTDKGPIDFNYLNSEGFMKGLSTLWKNKEETFKSAGLDLTSKDNQDLKLLTKLKHRNLRKVFIEMLDIVDGENEIGLQISDTLSQLDTAQILELKKDQDYNAEGIIGKTNFVEYFIITYYAKLIIGGDKRAGRDYITTEEYYEKYGVKDKSSYENRRNTILKKEDKERNYNSRPYIFRLEYKINGKEKSVEGSTFEEILSKTHLLTNNPK